MQDFSIRVAADSDFRSIAKWLKEELENDDLDGTFFNNIDMIESGAKNGRLVALIRHEDNLPVAFYLWNSHETDVDIFSVKGDCRRKGLGRRLATHYIEHAKKKDLIGLIGECAPVSSKPFWKSMGFKTVPCPCGTDNPNWVGLSLPKRHAVSGGNDRLVNIFRDSNGKRDLHLVFTTRAMEIDGKIQFENDFVLYAAAHEDPFIEVQIDNISIYKHKLKYFSVDLESRTPWHRLRCFRIETVGVELNF